MPAMRVRASATIARFASSCAAYATCCQAQPPQLPKTAQTGSVRAAPGASSSRTSARAKRLRCSVRRTRTRSPGAVKGTNTTRPSRARATPSPLEARRSIVSSSSAMTVLLRPGVMLARAAHVCRQRGGIMKGTGFSRGARGLRAVAIALALAACSQEKAELKSQPEPAQAAQASVLRVAAAASLRETAQEIGARFGAAEPATRVELSFGASSELAAQLRAGAPIDVLLSADEEIPRALEAEGLGTELRPFAGNRLVVVASLAAAGHVKQASDLTGDAVKRIAMPGPAVPIGHYAREWLTKVGLLEALEPR